MKTKTFDTKPFEFTHSNSTYVHFSKAHAQDIFNQFGGLPRHVVMLKSTYDKFIHGNDLCAYDLLMVMLGGPGAMMGTRPPFMMDSDGKWHVAIGNKVANAEGMVFDRSTYLVDLVSSKA